jgi:pyruvate/2-oxoglutarate dehydrogenase complex dihydrolipoamide acyltransferase (E2) component
MLRRTVRCAFSGSTAERVALSGPAVQRLARSMPAAAVAALTATGKGGRFTKADLLGLGGAAPAKLPATPTSTLPSPSTFAMATMPGEVANYGVTDRAVLRNLLATNAPPKSAPAPVGGNAAVPSLLSRLTAA